ncbi:blue copper protein-like [Primulina tabacum]
MEMAEAITFLLLLLHVFPAVYGATISVGGSSGWTTGFNYDSWANGQAFTTKDVLLFNYGPSHSVEEVSDSDYEDCNTNNPSIASYGPSPTSIPLSSTGTRYFICPTSNHCSQGMKLAVTITDGNSTATPPPPSTTIPPPPPRNSTVPPSHPPSTTASPPPRTTPTPSPSTRSSPPSRSPLAPTNTPPPAPSHGTILAARNSMFIEIFLVMATFFGLIG